MLRSSATRPWRLFVLLAYVGFLTWASLAPAKVIAKFPISFPYADKLFHFLIYGGLVAIARWTFIPGHNAADAPPAIVPQAPPLDRPLAGGADVPSASSLGVSPPSLPASGIRHPVFSLPPHPTPPFARLPAAPLLLVAIAYGFLMELLQSLMVSYGRTFEWLDVVANSLGALTFWILTTPRR